MYVCACFIYSTNVNKHKRIINSVKITVNKTKHTTVKTSAITMPQRSTNWSFTRNGFTNRKPQRHLPTLPDCMLPADNDYSNKAKSSWLRQKMETEKEEARNLQVEFEWVLREEVHAILKQLKKILVECAHRFPVPLYANEGKKTEKYIMKVAPEKLSAIVTLTGDSITHADISFKLARPPHHQQKTCITQDTPWKLQQVQDAANHLQQAINHIDDVDATYHFKTSDEVMNVVGNILEALQRARTSLVIPKKKPIADLIKSRNMKALAPNLSEDLAVSFYLQSHKLIMAVYQLITVQGTMRFDSCQAETTVQWLNDVMPMLCAGLKLCQQLKDKISVFSVYKDFTVESRPPSALSY